MSKRPKVFLLHGFLGVGKTTFARRLEREHHALRFTHDEWMSRLYGRDPPEALFSDYARRVSALMEGTWSRCVEVGANVVLDHGFWSWAERVRVRSLVCRLGGDPLLYRLQCSDAEAWRRIGGRNEQLAGSLHIAPNTFEVLRTRFEPLRPEEGRVEVATWRPAAPPQARIALNSTGPAIAHPNLAGSIAQARFDARGQISVPSSANRDRRWNPGRSNAHAEAARAGRHSPKGGPRGPAPA